MCEYCENRKIIFEEEFIDDTIFIMINDFVKIDDCSYDNYIVFIDRCFLRLAIKEDCSCMDHGAKIKINFCPFCGSRLEFNT
jgi:hypothetical protein